MKLFSHQVTVICFGKIIWKTVQFRVLLSYLLKAEVVFCSERINAQFVFIRILYVNDVCNFVLKVLYSLYMLVFLRNKYQVFFIETT